MRIKLRGIFILILLIVGGYFLYTKVINKTLSEEPEKFIYHDILTKIGDKHVSVDYFAIYGKYLNFEGTIPSEGNYNIVFKNTKDEIIIPTIIEGTTFKTNKYINDGINLEKLTIGNYIMLLCEDKKETEQEERLCYHLDNKTDYHDNKYYTITKNNKNNLITFNEKTYETFKYWDIDIKETKLPDDVYDFVIDPGHGGVDSGAVNGKYKESSFNLDMAKTLKEVLEEVGYKVKLTRETDKQIDNYGEGSRTGIPYEVKAKLMYSVHLNSSNYKGQSGVEVYYAYQDKNEYAKEIADNIVKYANTTYSNNPQNKILNGTYLRVYSKENIASLKKEAKRDGYEPYDFTDHETYYFFIRETGGIMTHAFSDGRNKKYKENIYRNYNQGVEAYLLELAYISNNSDVKNIINNKDGYIKAMKESILKYAEYVKPQESDTKEE